MSKAPVMFIKKEIKSVCFKGDLAIAIEDFDNGNKAKYEKILSEISDDKSKSGQIVQWFEEAAANCVLLNKSKTGLVERLLKVKWMQRGSEVTKRFCSFVVALVSSNPIHLQLVLKCLSRCLVPVESGAVDEEHLELIKKFAVPNKESHAIVHTLFRTILSLIPSSCDLLKKQLRSSFPFFKKPAEEIKTYVDNLLIFASYHPSSRTDVLQMIIKTICEIDVNTSRDQIEEEEEDESENEEEVEEMKLPLANTLDVLMDRLLEYIHGECHTPEGKLDHSKAEPLMKELVVIFSTTILPHHATSHVQFILFYVCALDKKFLTFFLSSLWQKTIDVSLPPHIRSGATCYIASFIARSKSVPLA